MKLKQSISKPYMEVTGGYPLQGTVQISGAKNAVLPILFSTLLADGEYCLYNVPLLKDVEIALEILGSLGFSFEKDKECLKIKSFCSGEPFLSKEMSEKMRASCLCLGPLLARYGQVNLPLPGGCQIGERSIDIHLKGLKALGAQIEHLDGQVKARAPQGLKGTSFSLDFPSVGGTENLIMASVLAEGLTTLKNCAEEPEIEDLICCLKKMGANIEKMGERELQIRGVKKLEPFVEHKVIPDRIEAGTFLLAGAITAGEVTVKNVEPSHLESFLEALKKCGFLLDIQDDRISLKSVEEKRAISVETGVYPGFPTDLQSPFIALMTQLEGASSLKETIFENRMAYIEELKKFKVPIKIQGGREVFVKGPVLLEGALVEGTDLRASAGLILAALAAKGTSRIGQLFHLDRGYENFHKKLKTLGAFIDRKE